MPAQPTDHCELAAPRAALERRQVAVALGAEARTRRGAVAEPQDRVPQLRGLHAQRDLDEEEAGGGKVKNRGEPEGKNKDGDEDGVCGVDEDADGCIIAAKLTAG